MKKLIAKIARLIKTVINGMYIDILRNKRYEKEKTMVEKKLRLLKILSFFLIL